GGLRFDPAIAIRRGLKLLHVRTDTRTRLGGQMDRILMVKNNKYDQSLVGLVVISAGREDHSSISATAIGRELKSLNVRTDS
ncbi:hypothetical protein A2U01_0049805, partial [Trifolium medium]|nr:hypothetical protein [Trifolium medium]